MSDPHPSGGSLADMAPDGTKIPEDAGTQRLIPAVPNPDQASQSQSSGSNLAAAATNPTDIPRSNQDIGVTGEVVTAYGDSMPAEIETKRLGMQSGDMANAKGDGRREKHIDAKGSQFDKLAADGPDVEAAPGEENEDQETLRSRRE